MAVRRDRSEAVDVRGVREFVFAVRKLDKAQGQGLQRALRAANRAAGKRALAQVRASASTKLERRAARTLRLVASATGAGIELSKDRFGGVFGAEFGGGKYGKGHPTPAGGHTTQFEPHRGRVGYFVFPTLREGARGETQYLFGAAVDDALAEAFPD